MVSSAEPLTDLDPENSMVQELLHIETISQYFKADKGVIVFPDFNRNAVIINTDSNLNLFECCEQIKTLIVNKLKCNICIGVGDKHNDINQFQQGYREAVEALNYKLVYGNNLVISYNDISIKDTSVESPAETKVDMDEILFFVRAGLVSKAHELISLKFDEISEKATKSSNEIRVFAISLITSILNTISENDFHLSDFFNVSEVYNHILILNNIPDIKAYILEVSEKITYDIKELRENKKNNLMDKVLGYIEENIQNAELTLSSLASNFYINPSYLSRTFKQHTGYNFVEYLTRLRIQKAIEYFEKYDKMAYEVAENVGIPDPNYFGKCFKKYTGYSVNDYKRHISDKFSEV